MSDYNFAWFAKQLGRFNRFHAVTSSRCQKSLRESRALDIAPTRQIA